MEEFAANVPLPPAFREHFGTAEEIAAQLAADRVRIERTGITLVVCQVDPLEPEKTTPYFESLLREA
ncbi:hypothetical protein GGS21DRAFT_511896 [Xylaria nigripes]|nr:hypothetical protein GGS21DRAFT_511896 [Xylaria nigripes]